jgi:hypothetical protein
VSIQGFAGPAGLQRTAMAPLDAHRRGLYRLARRDAVSSMKNGLYSIHIHMLDGVKGRDSGILVLRDGVLIGGGPYFWSVGTYSVGDGTWKGELRTNQHTPFADPFVRPLFGGQEVTSGFSGTFGDDQAEVFGTTLVGTKSLSFRATLKRLADD